MGRLGRTNDPETFLWRILPVAARTFSACISMLPKRMAYPAAVAYLYCRMLDTYEDLILDPQARERALTDFVSRFENGGVRGAAPELLDPDCRDDADRAHVLLVRRSGLIDQLYAKFGSFTQSLIIELITAMSEEMRWASARLAEQGNIIRANQLSRYCYGVLGTTILFSARLFRADQGVFGSLPPGLRADAVASGEFIQLANITRDIEKDLARGVAYDETLRAWLGQITPAPQSEVEPVRRRLVLRALGQAPAYGGLINQLKFRRWSLQRGSATLMFGFSERYYARAASRCGGADPARTSGARLLLRALGASLSPTAARAQLNSSSQRLSELQTALQQVEESAAPRPLPEIESNRPVGQ